MVDKNQTAKIPSLFRSVISSAIKNDQLTTNKIQNLKQLEW